MSGSRVRSAFSGRTAWARSLQAPLRDFLTTETGSASVLLAAAVAALAWANIDLSSYESVWRTQLSIHVGGSGISQGLRDWVNSGLMTFFFFVVGLEVRREFDVGELRERRRLALPVLAALGGMAVPVAIYLAFNGGGGSAQGWGVAMSTDTAFALGMLALVGPRFPDRLRGFMLTIIVVDDVVALLVIAVAYSGDVDPRAAADRLRRLRPGPGRPRRRIRQGLVYFLLARSPGWRCSSPASTPSCWAWRSAWSPGPTRRAAASWSGRRSCSAASASSRRRSWPAPRAPACEAAVSPNARLLQLYHPWTSYVVVPLFALANVGIAIDGDFLSRAYSSPITLGILFAYVLGKPVGVDRNLLAGDEDERRTAAPAGRLGRHCRRRARSPESASPSPC